MCDVCAEAISANHGYVVDRQLQLVRSRSSSPERSKRSRRAADFARRRNRRQADRPARHESGAFHTPLMARRGRAARTRDLGQPNRFGHRASGLSRTRPRSPYVHGRAAAALAAADQPRRCCSLVRSIEYLIVRRRHAFLRNRTGCGACPDSIRKISLERPIAHLDPDRVRPREREGMVERTWI
ncbi:MAG: hypothetical protein MZU97_05120 [Bacillus subtilis]|nr:hypothetical protein [Bacillus subtilis]